MNDTRTTARIVPEGILFSGTACSNCGTPYRVCARRIRNFQPTCCVNCGPLHDEHPASEDAPYDQDVDPAEAIVRAAHDTEAAAREVRLVEVAEHLPRRSDGSVDIMAMAAETTRKAVLNVHTRHAVAEALQAMRNAPTTWAGKMDALKVLQKAAPRYIRLGGEPDYWGSERRRS